jgi:hypothetical protein
MCNAEQVKAFLGELETKFILLAEPVSFGNREKNMQALIDLDIPMLSENAN